LKGIRLPFLFMVKKTFPWLQIAVHIIGWLPLAKLILDFTANNLTANPIQAMI
jgi:hypothetical protein